MGIVYISEREDRNDDTPKKIDFFFYISNALPLFIPTRRKTRLHANEMIPFFFLPRQNRVNGLAQCVAQLFILAAASQKA